MIVKNKFETLSPWMGGILSRIKKDLKTDYLPGDRVFYKKYFGNRPLNRLSTDEIFAAVEKELLGENEALSEWVVNHWVFQHGDIYTHFAEKLSCIRPDFNELSELSEEESQKVLEGSEPFGAISVYLFSVLNGVVFSSTTFEQLRLAAMREKEAKEAIESSQNLQETLEQIIERQRREISRLQEKCESKVAGVLRKYELDTQALKTQIRSLQKKLQP